MRFYPDLADGVHQLQRQFDPVGEELRKLGIRHSVIYSAKLLITHKEKTQVFKTPTEALEFVKKIQKNTNGNEYLD